MNAERYVRQHIYGAAHRATVSVAGGLLPLVEKELQQLASRMLTPDRPGFEIAEREGRIELRGIDYRALVELTLRLSTALDLRLEIARGKAGDRGELEGLLRGMPWEVYLPRGARVEVRADSRGSRLYHEGLIEECAAAALGEAGLQAGESEHHLVIRLEDNRARVELSLAGAPLWRRGYRSAFDAKAPLREDLAQGAIRSALSFAAEEGSAIPFIDSLLLPFAGSGTLLFESLIALYGIAPCLFGRSYAFEGFAFGAPPSAAWLRERLSKEAALRFASAPRLRAVLIDSHPGAIRSARENLSSFRTLLRPIGALPLDCTLREADALAASWAEQLPSGASSLFVPLNPPYGHRLAVASADRLYERIGESLERLAGEMGVAGTPAAGAKGRMGASGSETASAKRITGFVLCPSEGAWRRFQNATPALRKRTTHFGQGGLDIRLCVFAAGG